MHVAGQCYTDPRRLRPQPQANHAGHRSTVSSGHFERDRPQQTRRRFAPVARGDGAVMVGKGVEHEHFDPVLTGPGMFAKIDAPRRRDAYARQLAVHPDFGGGDHLAQIKLEFARRLFRCSGVSAIVFRYQAPPE